MWIFRKRHKKLKVGCEECAYYEARKEISNVLDVNNQYYFDDYYVICSKQHYLHLKDATRIYENIIKETEADVEKYKKKYAEEFQKRMQLVDVLSRMEKCENNTPENTEKGESN